MNKQDWHDLFFTRVDFWNITPQEREQWKVNRRINETHMILQAAFAKLAWQYYLLFDQAPDRKQLKWLLEQFGYQAVHDAMVAEKQRISPSLNGVYQICLERN